MTNYLHSTIKTLTYEYLYAKFSPQCLLWSDGRVVEGGGLENRCTARYRGFESPLLRAGVVREWPNRAPC